MVRPERFELPTYCSGGNRSIHLSYGRAAVDSVYMGELRTINVSASDAFWRLDVRSDPMRMYRSEVAQRFR